jgi:hypothetical protein
MNLGQTVSINELPRLIRAVGDSLTVLIQSEPGCGKTSILKTLCEQNKDVYNGDSTESPPNNKYDYVYFDAPVKDMTDLGMYIPNHETRTLSFYVADLFKPRSGKPKIIMIDEALKVNKLMKTLLTRLMLERSVGDYKLPEGSIVFATSNNSTDGVGDVIQAHEGNRIMRVFMRKPNAKEWGVWATDNGISALTRAWVACTPAALNSYTELNDTERANNPFIFDPKRANISFVSPRSLEKNDIVVRSRGLLGESVTEAAMQGTVGEAAAKAMQAFFLIEKDLTAVSTIIADPEKVGIPDNIGALLMIMFNAVDEIQDQDDLSQFMKWVLRVKNAELQSVFYTMVCQSKRTVKMAGQNKFLNDWIVKNFVLFS